VQTALQSDIPLLKIIKMTLVWPWNIGQMSKWAHFCIPWLVKNLCEHWKSDISKVQILQPIFVKISQVFA
jgi:hypothetical protein